MTYKCNLLMPGAPKSGTSTLHGLLAQHPRLCMSRPKEPQFFSFDVNYAGGVEAHNALFDREDAAYFGESSQCYMWHDIARERIAENLRAPKIILLLRHPVERALSHYRWRLRKGWEPQSFADAVAARGETTEYRFDPGIGMHKEAGGYLAASRYSHWVPKWRDTFGAENVLLADNADLSRDPQGLVDRCTALLGLAPHRLDVVESRNRTADTRRKPSAFMLRLGRVTPAGLKSSAFYRGLRERLLEARTPDPDRRITADDEAWLARELADEVAFFERLFPADGATARVA